MKISYAYKYIIAGSFYCFTNYNLFSNGRQKRGYSEISSIKNNFTYVSMEYFLKINSVSFETS